MYRNIILCPIERFSTVLLPIDNKPSLVGAMAALIWPMLYRSCIWIFLMKYATANIMVVLTSAPVKCFILAEQYRFNGSSSLREMNAFSKQWYNFPEPNCFAISTDRYFIVKAPWSLIYSNPTPMKHYMSDTTLLLTLLYTVQIV